MRHFAGEMLYLSYTAYRLTSLPCFHGSPPAKFTRQSEEKACDVLPRLQFGLPDVRFKVSVDLSKLTSMDLETDRLKRRSFSEHVFKHNAMQTCG
jgi:hypothetical protein